MIIEIINMYPSLFPIPLISKYLQVWPSKSMALFRSVAVIIYYTDEDVVCCLRGIAAVYFNEDF